jgi:hypothetical protein
MTLWRCSLIPKENPDAAAGLQVWIRTTANLARSPSGQELAKLGNSQQTLGRDITILVTGRD